ncbi:MULTISPECIES: phosphoenolpyruvate--protein phosphotransferase [Tepidibacillus]|uniref:Phosphoenolpyruvate-protein phosphotransferase n=1 Tax=Tepidibacillus decaturensis TaxID=1413211 RepID=A0A135L6V7_9BACI|nr:MULTISPECIES: phosphoenolpyruvate--protein phosphotransferase [Tepidibacillus]KXG44712.1 phosphoenolpyruvate--protein phosphotransferase [Tepidibacillus decaturensis]GBF12518.1 phosphoenolpyruvate-protein phosphotransferase [Tepidibacillus sp. HK-1]
MNWTGIAASSGIAMGPAFLLKEDKIEVKKHSLQAEQVEQEINRFEEKVKLAIDELELIKKKALQKLGEKEAEIFSAHILVLQDPEYIGAVKDKIKTDLINAEAALQEITDQFIMIFESMDNEYMRERAADIRDVSSRVLKRLLGIKEMSLDEFAEPVILIAHDLTPSDTAQLNREMVAGFATNIGGRTSHSAIMARSMEIPAVVGLKDILEKTNQEDYVIIDGNEGIVYINPENDLVMEYRTKKEQYEAHLAELKTLKNEASITADGHQVEIVANIGNPQDGKGALENGAEGIGLFRTEFLYMGRSDLPSEEEQFAAYKTVAEMFSQESPVVIRSLDIGGDKELPYLNLPKEMNPFLGYRAIRLCLDRTDIFKTQLRAILRASVFGNIKLMYPMIASLQELRQANQVLEEVKQELINEKVPFNPEMEVGMMIEIPAAAIIADQLAKEVDFFSIGTNDLIQYTMAADRMNEQVSYLYQPFNPAVLRLIHMVIQAAHKEGKWAGMCGEMAGHLTAIPILLGMGLDEFSMSASSVLPARSLIRKLNVSEMKNVAQKVLQMETAEEIKEYVEQEVLAKLK